MLVLEWLTTALAQQSNVHISLTSHGTGMSFDRALHSYKGLVNFSEEDADDSALYARKQI
jgi:hypothetical protein